MSPKPAPKKSFGEKKSTEKKPLRSPGSKKSAPASKEAKESNRGKRGSSREPETFYKGRKGASEKLADKKPSDKGPYEKNSFEKKPFEKKPFEKKGGKDWGKPFKNPDNKKFPDKLKGDGQGGPKKFFTSKYTGDKPADWKPKVYDGKMRLNKFLSNAGIASRRDADKLIELGLVQVNGKVIIELGFKVDPLTDTVKYDDRNLKPEKLRYILLNKPKDYITTMDDPEERKTVMWLVKDACKERIYPVGRLDRQTTGLLLFTNDGDLAKRLTHPRDGFPKLYHIETIEKIKGTDLDAIRAGVKLEDGFIQADEISYVGDDPRQVGIRIHSGRNRIVRRIFEHFNYTVKKLDRVMFAGLTKKDLARGRHRSLTEQEINFLKMIR